MNKSIESWAEYAMARKSPGTVKNYKGHIAAFTEWLGQRPVDQCVVEDYVTGIVSTRSKVAANNHIAALKAFFSWYAPRRRIPNPVEKLELFSHRETRPMKQRFLTEEEYQAVLAVANKGIERDTVEFLANTGLRRSEYLTLTPRSVNAKKTHLIIKGGKGDKDREVPVNSIIRELLDRNTSDGVLLCVSYWKRPEYLWHLCQSLARRAEIPAFGPHSLRHYFATALILKGVPLKIVSRILGHNSVLMTERVYCHILNTDTTGATDCLCV